MNEFMKKFLLPLQNMVRADLFFRFFGSLERARQPHPFPPATPEPRSARRGQNSVRAISKIHRQKGFCKRGLSASLRSAANLYWIFGEKEEGLLLRAKEIFS